MNRNDIIRMAEKCGIPEFENNESQADNILRFAALVRAAERNKLAAWMIAQGYATGHGDAIEQLLEELRWQVRESEREACKGLVWSTPEPEDEYLPLRQAIADAISARRKV
jgi:hypothetical protein